MFFTTSSIMLPWKIDAMAGTIAAILDHEDEGLT